MRIDSTLVARISALTVPLSGAIAPLRRFDPGQVLHGRVLAVRGSQVMISLLGEQISAESLLPLRVGQVLDLVVHETRPDRITLRIATEVGGKAPVLQPFTDQDVGELLVEQHLPTDPTNTLIVRSLIRNMLPITNANVLAIGHALSFIETPTAEDVDAALFLIARELPVTPQSLKLAKSALLQPNSLGTRVQALATQLVELLLRPVREGAAVGLPRPLLALAQQVLQDLPLLLPDQAQGRTLASLIRQVLDQIATPTEARLARVLREPGVVLLRPDPPVDQTTTRSPDTGAAHTVIIEPPPITDGYTDTAQADGHHVLPASWQRRTQDASHDFRQQLALLEDTLVHAITELPARHTAVATLHELQATIRELISTMEADQLTNAGTPPPTQAQGYYLFHLPIATVGQDTTDTAEVRIYYQQRDRTKQVDPENAHLAFLLQMNWLGPVDVHVDLYRTHLRCRIECSRQEATELFRESSHELEERLQDIGYVVDSIRTATIAGSEVRTDREAMLPLSRIDIQA